MIDALILNYNDAKTTIECALRLETYSIVSHVLIVDNCSNDSSWCSLSEITSNKIILISNKHNGGYGAGNNLGIRYLADKYQSEYIMLCNPDTIISENSVVAMYSFLLQHPEHTIVAPMMCNVQMETQFNTAFRIPRKWEYICSLELINNKFRKPFYYKDLDSFQKSSIDVGAVSGSLFMMNVKKMIQYGMYDENIFLYCEEMVIGIKLKNKGNKTALLLSQSFIHNHSVSINKTVKSQTKRHLIFLRSKLYVIKQYYRANWFELAIARLLAGISIVELWVVNSMRGIFK